MHTSSHCIAGFEGKLQAAMHKPSEAVLKWLQIAAHGQLHRCCRAVALMQVRSTGSRGRPRTTEALGFEKPHNSHGSCCPSRLPPCALGTLLVRHHRIILFYMISRPSHHCISDTSVIKSQVEVELQPNGQEGPAAAAKLDFGPLLEEAADADISITSSLSSDQGKQCCTPAIGPSLSHVASPCGFKWPFRVELAVFLTPQGAEVALWGVNAWASPAFQALPAFQAASSPHVHGCQNIIMPRSKEPNPLIDTAPQSLQPDPPLAPRP
jgi:hypothetical protein